MELVVHWHSVWGAGVGRRGKQAGKGSSNFETCSTKASTVNRGPERQQNHGEPSLLSLYKPASTLCGSAAKVAQLPIHLDHNGANWNL
jgi:hypothetical protein